MSFLAPIDRNPSPAKLRELAGTFAVVTVLLVLHAVFVRGDRERAIRFGAVGTALALAPLVPVAGRVVYVAWMGLGAAIGRVTAPLVLSLVYFVVLVPLGLFGRALGRDRLGTKRRPEGSSYWRPVPKTARKSDYFRPF